MFLGLVFYSDVAPLALGLVQGAWTWLILPRDCMTDTLRLKLAAVSVNLFSCCFLRQARLKFLSVMWAADLW